MSTTMTMTAPEASHYKSEQHYTELSTPLQYAPPVLVFFSFLDQTSYQWANNNKVVSTIRRHVPNGTTVARYHVPTGCPPEFAQDLTHAWAVAHELQIDDRVIELMFEAIHGPTRAVDMQGVKAVFDHVGIPPLRFDREYAKLGVKNEAKWMAEAAQRLDIRNLPAIVVGGRYLIQTEAFGTQMDVDAVADVIKELLALKR